MKSGAVWGLGAACLVALFLAAGAGAQSRSVIVRVAAASDLRFAFEEIVEAFRRLNADVEVVSTYGSSGNFHAQLVQGAPFDLFLSADRSYTDDLVRRGRADASAVFTYAIGRLVLWVRTASPLNVANGFAVLRDPRIRHVAIANPLHAPYGRAAESAMKNAGVWSDVQPKLVLGDNVTQAAQFVESGAADIGVIARSLAVAPPMRNRGRSWEIPASTHPPLEQAGVILAGGPAAGAAARLRAFIVGSAGRAILTRHGFVLPEGAP